MGEGGGDQAKGWLCVNWRNGYRIWVFGGRGTSLDTSGN